METLKLSVIEVVAVHEPGSLPGLCTISDLVFLCLEPTPVARMTLDWAPTRARAPSFAHNYSLTGAVLASC